MKSLKWLVLLGVVVPLEAQTLIAVRWWMRRYDQQGDNSIRCYLSSDAGATWLERSLITYQYCNDAGIGLSELPSVVEPKLYLIFQPGESTGGGTRSTLVYCSEDTGSTWTPLSSPGIWDRHDMASAGIISPLNKYSIYNPLFCFTLNTSSGYLVFLSSTDEGASWDTLSQISVGYPSQDPEGDMCFDENGKVYIADWTSTSSPKCFVSTDWGTTWPYSYAILTESGSGNCRVVDITYHYPSRSLYALLWSGSTRPTVVRSTNRGQDWQQVGTVNSQYMNADGGAAISVDQAGNLYALLWDRSTDLRLFVSSDGGASWQYRSTVAAGHADECACGSELVILDATPLGLEEDGPRSPGCLRIVGDRVWLNLEQPGQCAIKVYDATGRRVDNLVDGYLESGVHEFRMENASYGIYFIEAKLPEKRLTVSFVR